MDEMAMKLGLLLESAQAQQAMAESLASNLRAHIEGMDAVVREEIRRTVVQELGAVVSEASRAADALRRIGRTGVTRHALWATALTLACVLAPLPIVRWSMPSAAELSALEARRDRLTENVAALVRRGGALELKECGREPRVCVRVDRSAPAYGAGSDFYVVAER